ncbi:hypothetical protein [Streptomyces sp. NPDC059008]
MAAQIAVLLREIGIPGGLIGYEHQPLIELVCFEGNDEWRLAIVACSDAS